MNIYPVCMEEYIDQLDIRILEELATNSKRSYHKLASNLHVSPTTILKRIKALESAGYIKSYSIITDHKMLGYDITAIIEISADGSSILKVEEYLSKQKSTCAVYDTTGICDSIVIAKFKSIEELDRFVKTLNNIEGVNKTNTHIALNVVKEDFRIL